MTTVTKSLIGASSACKTPWETINWAAVEKQVRRLQMRIAKATREGRHGKVKALQWLLTHSYSAKLCAVKRVVGNQGRKTAGVDGITWKTAKQKMQAVWSIKRRGYRPQPLRRIYIKKKNGKLRPLGIPTMYDRAQQALYLLALEPIAETLADKNSYGFRKERSTIDAIEQCFISLAKKNQSKVILEGDIRACFDQISHPWILENVPMDKSILRKWLTAGYIEKNVFHTTEEGTPQGGIVSPTLANMTLDGLEKAIKEATSKPDKVNFVRYADDFIITGITGEVLEEKVKPIVESFLRERGLELSPEKTKITHISKGFDFLGFNVRKYDGKLLIKPSNKNVKAFLAKIRETIKSNKTAKTENLIHLLNPMIRGWTNYFRNVVSKKTFGYVDHSVFKALWQWAKRRHPNKGSNWVRKKYFRSKEGNNWVFFAKLTNKKGREVFLNLFSASKVSIVRHVKIRAEATPYDPDYIDYFKRRRRTRKCR